MKYPKISIVTPSYNQSQFLENTILSVINQDYKNIEYIIIDGLSTDNSVEIIKKYENKLKFWSSEEDNGQSDAIAKGFEKSTGDILCWLNSDDFFVKGALSNVARHFEKNVKTDILIGDGIYADSEGKIIKYYRYMKPNLFFSKNGIVAFCQQSMFFNRKYYFKSGGISRQLHYCMDSEFIYRSIRDRCQFSIMHKPAGIFRWQKNMKSLNPTFVKKKEMNYIANKYHSVSLLGKFARFMYIFIQIVNLNYVISKIKLLTINLKILKLT